MHITILMPCLNEGEALPHVFKDIPFEKLQRDGYLVDVLVVDGGSSDGSVEIASRLGAKTIVTARGYGRQYREGLAHAQGEIIVTADSDASYPLEIIPDLVPLLTKNGYDFISVNRFDSLPKEAMPTLNMVGNLVLTRAVNLLFGLNLKDSQSGMWLIRRSCLSQLQLLSPGMSFSQEIKIEAFSKLRACEVPGYYKMRKGRPKLKPLRDGTGNILHLLKRWYHELKTP